ncbi:MAG: hypothetical protein ACRDF4_07035, partial [Rhabdochlamydiaceae bacterium]
MKTGIYVLCETTESQTVSVMTRAPEKSGFARPTSQNAKKKEDFSKSKLAMSLDYIFGKGTSRALNDYSEDIDFFYSRRTG